MLRSSVTTEIEAKFYFSHANDSVTMKIHCAYILGDAFFLICVNKIGALNHMKQSLKTSKAKAYNKFHPNHQYKDKLNNFTVLFKKHIYILLLYLVKVVPVPGLPCFHY